MESGPSTTKIMLCGLVIVALIMIGTRVQRSSASVECPIQKVGKK